MDKEAVGMARETVERAVREAGGIVHRDGNIFFTDYRQMQAAMALAQQTAAQAARGVPEGWKLVPVELTGEMAAAGKRAGGVPRYAIVASWGAMLAATPTPPDGDAERDRLLALLREARTTLEMWKDVAPAVSLCADIDAAMAASKEA